MIQLSKQKIDFNDSNNIKPDGGSKHFTIFDLLTRSLPIGDWATNMSYPQWLLLAVFFKSL